MIKKPKTLYFDIETSPCTAFVWSTGKQFVQYNQMGKEWNIICVSYMWDTDKKPTSISFDLNKYDLTKFDDDSDKKLLKEFSEIYNSAEVVVAHNGQHFDISKIRARLVKYGLPDLDPIIVSDTYIKSKRIGFTSHKLDSIGKFLNLGRKSHTDFDLWLKVIHKDKKALDYMVKYCEQDVKLLRQVHLALAPYIKPSVNLAVYNQDNTLCHKCGHNRFRNKGYTYTRLGKYLDLRCTKCFTTQHRGENLLANAKSYTR